MRITVSHITKDFVRIALTRIIDARVETCNIRVLCTFIAILFYICLPVCLADRACHRSRLSMSVIDAARIHDNPCSSRIYK